MFRWLKKLFRHRHSGSHGISYGRYDVVHCSCGTSFMFVDEIFDQLDFSRRFYHCHVIACRKCYTYTAISSWPCQNCIEIKIDRISKSFDISHEEAAAYLAMANLDGEIPKEH